MDLPAEQQTVLDHALALLSAGDVEQASTLYRNVLATHPSQADALHYLGVIELQSNRIVEAVDLIQQAVDARPGYVDAIVNLGYGLNALGRFGDAIAQYESAIEHGPATAILFANLGGALEQSGRYAEAVERFTAALKLQPDLAEVRRSLADSLLKLGRIDDALLQIQTAASQNSRSLEIRVSTGNILLAAGRVEDAVRCFSEVLDKRPDLYALRANLAMAQRKSGRFDDAIEQYQLLLAEESDNSEYHFQLGILHQEQGHKSDAMAAFRKAVELDSACAKAWYGIAAVTKDAFTDNEVDQLIDRQQCATTKDADRLLLGFALGKHFEQAGRHTDAASQYLFANPIKRAEFDYDLENDLSAYDNIRACFDAAFLDKWKDVGLADSRPIFIVGMPRSGTTLVEQILASHPQIFGAGEHTLLTSSILGAFPITDGRDYTAELADATPETFQAVAQNYLDAIPTVEEHFVTDKLPHNFLNLGMIRILFPNASIVHCRRDARDTCFSIYKNLFGSHSHFYGYDLEELGRYYRAYAELMDHWDTVMPGRIHTVDYETLVEDQETTTRALLKACGIDWDSACLDFHKTERPVVTLSALQVRQPVYRSSIGAWKNYENMLAPLLDRLMPADERSNLTDKR